MAYVGTPSYLGNDQYTLASIIQGEASTFAGQTAVANVMANRAAINFQGNGSSILSQALSPMQFQGQATPTAQSLSIAQQALNGTLPQSVPGALYYANPGASQAQWARNLDSTNSVNIGGNYFTDNQNGIPYTTTQQISGAQPEQTFGLDNSSLSVADTQPQVGADNVGTIGAPTPQSYDYFNASPSLQNTPATMDVPTNSSYNIGSFSPTDFQNSGSIASPYGGSPSAAPFGGQPQATYTSFPTSMSPDATYSNPSGNDNIGTIGSFAPTDFQQSGGFSAGDAASGATTTFPTASGTTSFQNPGQSFGGVSQAAQGSSFNSSNPLTGSQIMGGGGLPVNITDITGAASIAGQSVQSGLNTAAQSITSSEQSAATTGTGWLNTALTYGESWFQRGGIAIFGLIFVGLGLLWLTKTNAAARA